MNNLGNTLLALGRRENGTIRLEGAIAAYRDALSVFEPAGVASTNNVQQNLELEPSSCSRRSAKSSASSSTALFEKGVA